MSKNITLYVREQRQLHSVHSFVGGVPRIPADLVLRNWQFCNNPQTFFFQLAFGEGHVWQGRTLALFACTLCAPEDHLIPEMLSVQLAGAEIPAGFVSSYQKNFQICTFDTEQGELRQSYNPIIEYREITSTKSRGLIKFGEFGSPVWQMEDESPSSYAGRSLEFLFQLTMDFEFPLVDGALPQQSPYELDWPDEREFTHYELFVGNELYFFGTEEAPCEVYILPQCD